MVSIAICASPPSSVCSTPHQIAASDFNLSTSPSQKPIGGLSSLFSVKSDDFSSSLRRDRDRDRSDDYKDLSSFCYSPARFAGSSSYHRRDRHQSPISVLQGPLSCSCRTGSYRAKGLFDRFVTKAVGSCVDYELGPSSPSSSSEELTTFPMEDDTRQPYARNLLRRAQLRHKIFEDESVIKAFYEAEKAHRGQVYIAWKQTPKPFIFIFIRFLVFDWIKCVCVTDES